MRGTPRPDTDRRERLARANAFLRAIASCGRRFFFTPRSPHQEERVAHLEVDERGRVWFVDDYSGKRIYTHYRGAWRGFTHGGTLKGLILYLREYLVRGLLLPRGSLGPWPDWVGGNGDLWGYGLDMKKVRQSARDLGLLEG